MAGKQAALGVFEPDHLYTIDHLAEVLQVEKRTIKRHLLENGSCAHKRVGNLVLIKGSWLIAWAMEDYTPPRTGDE